MTILTCECGNEIYIMEETGSRACQSDAWGRWCDSLGCMVAPPGQTEAKPSPHLINWSAGEDL